MVPRTIENPWPPLRGLRSGITFFDTADLYGDGRSERLVGQVLKGKHPPELWPRSGLRGRTAQTQEGFQPCHILDAAEQSLRRLQREAIDLYQLHNPTLADVESGEAFGVMDELVTAGKCGSGGCPLGHGIYRGLRRPWPVPRRQASRSFITSSNASIWKNAKGDPRKEIWRGGPGSLEYGMLTGKFSLGLASHRAIIATRAGAGRVFPQTGFRWRLAEAFKGKSFSLAQLAIGFVLSHPDSLW